MRRLRSAVAATLFVVATGATACGDAVVRNRQGLEFVVPAASPVQVGEVGDEHVQHFPGTFTISGTFQYGYVASGPDPDEAAGEPELVFEPDAEAALPYLKESGVVRRVQLRNADAFVAEMIDADSLEALKQGKVRLLSGHIDLVARDFEASMECDWPWYSVEFVSAKRDGQALASRELIDHEGC